MTNAIEKTSVKEEDLEALEVTEKKQTDPGPTTTEMLGLEESDQDDQDERNSDPNFAIRSSFTIIRKKIATQIREDTSKRVMAITSRQWATEDMLEKEIARCEAENRASEDALVKSVLTGGQHD